RRRPPVVMGTARRRVGAVRGLAVPAHDRRPGLAQPQADTRVGRPAAGRPPHGCDPRRASTRTGAPSPFDRLANCPRTTLATPPPPPAAPAASPPSEPPPGARRSRPGRASSTSTGRRTRPALVAYNS